MDRRVYCESSPSTQENEAVCLSRGRGPASPGELVVGGHSYRVDADTTVRLGAVRTRARAAPGLLVIAVGAGGLVVAGHAGAGLWLRAGIAAFAVLVTGLWAAGKREYRVLLVSAHREMPVLRTEDVRVALKVMSALQSVLPVLGPAPSKAWGQGTHRGSTTEGT